MSIPLTLSLSDSLIGSQSQSFTTSDKDVGDVIKLLQGPF